MEEQRRTLKLLVGRDAGVADPAPNCSHVGFVEQERAAECMGRHRHSWIVHNLSRHERYEHQQHLAHVVHCNANVFLGKQLPADKERVEYIEASLDVLKRHDVGRRSPVLFKQPLRVGRQRAAGRNDVAMLLERVASEAHHCSAGAAVSNCIAHLDAAEFRDHRAFVDKGRAGLQPLQLLRRVLQLQQLLSNVLPDHLRQGLKT